MGRKRKDRKKNMILYRVMYRPLHKYKDTIFDMWAKDYDSMVGMLRSKGVPIEVKHLYVHEYGENGVKEVLTYEAPDDEQLTNKPRVKLKTTAAKILELSGKSVKHGLYTAYEVAGCA